MQSRMITRGGVAALALATAVSLTACSPAAESGGEGGEVVKIGFIGALTGGSASLNVPALHGIELAIEHLNESGELDGRTIEVVSADDEADATKSAQAAQRLITEEGVIAIIGGGNSGTVAANNPIVTGEGVVQLIGVAQNDPLIDPASPGFPLTFRATENNSYDVGAIVQLFIERDYQHICAIADTTDYGQGGIATINKVFEQNGLSVADVVTHEVGATDMTPQVLTLRDAGCDSVYLFSLGAEAAAFMRAVNNADWDVPIIGGRGLNQAAFLSIAQGAGDGIIMPSVIDPEKESTKAFIEAFDAKFGADVDPGHVFSALGYDSLNILVAALKAADWKGGEALAKALQELDYEGVAGRDGSSYSYSADDHEGPGENFLTFMRIEDGAYVLESRDVPSGK